MSVNEDKDLVSAEEQDNAPDKSSGENASGNASSDDPSLEFGNEDDGKEEKEGEETLPTDSLDASGGGAESDDDEDDEEEEEGMTLLQHLEELRVRLMRCVIAVAVGFVACYAFSEQLFDYLMMPMEQVLRGSHFQYTYPPEAFFTYIKISIVAGVFVVSPYLFAQVWGFIAPGLYEHERKWFIPLVLVTALLFTAGSMFGYFVVFPFGFDFFASFSTEEIKFVPKLSEYTSFCLKLLFAFGLAFELPVFIFFLSRMGLVTSKGLRSKRKYAILVAFIVSAILTPPDPFTQMLMAVPIIILYESGIWIAAIFGKRKPEPEVDDDDDDDGSDGDGAGEDGAGEDGVEKAPETV